MRRTRTTNNQDAENGSLRRSHFAQALAVPTKSTPRLSLVAASQGDRFEHPAGFNSCIETDSGVCISIQQHELVSYKQTATDHSFPAVCYQP